ncbi:hypothetical protein BGZ99_003588 [Dissophora globulifera]|uniref:Uncharacterized protein n=1 Tax=Dissophora globulifera TaxID=979702 RepID=A0A9P6RLV7_9FUNG|nr:hypothetical protein BGZ99_003588 [Dissophora globulifera]
MLKSGHLVRSRNHSFESNTPPPYIQSPDDIYATQDSDIGLGRSMGKEQDYGVEQEYDDDGDVDLLAQVHQINDPELLKQLLIQKEQERQDLASNLDLAARLGLDLHQQIQRLELESSVKLQALQDENLTLQSSKANLSHELSYQLAHSEHEVRELTGHNRFLQRELDNCRQELKAFRKELDELSEHMAEISTEMVDAKTKVNSYARRLGEVEQELASTQELNVNLQIQLDNTLQKQKQTHSTTTQAVKLIQSDLGKVFSDSSTMRLTLEELETRQVQCEGKVMEMMTNTREYAQLLEEAQETIHTLRIESDMEGRGWSSRGSHAAIWDNKTGEHPEQYMRGMEALRPTPVRRLSSNIADMGEGDQQRLNAGEDLDPTFDTMSWGMIGGNSLGTELGHNMLNDRGLAGVSRSLDQEFESASRGLDLEHSAFGASTLDQERTETQHNRGSLANELEAIENRPNIHSDLDELHRIQLSFEPEDDISSLRTSMDSLEEDYRTRSSVTPMAPQRSSVSVELEKILVERNILQRIRSTTNTSGIVDGSGSTQHSSGSNRDFISRTLSMMTLPNQKVSSTFSSLLSPKQSPTLSRAPTAAEADSVVSRSTSSPATHNDDSGADISSASFSSVMSPPGLPRASVPNKNLKFLLSATSHADLQRVITGSSSSQASTSSGAMASATSSLTALSSRDTKARQSAATASAASAAASGKRSLWNTLPPTADGKRTSNNGSLGKEGKARASATSSSLASTSSKRTTTPTTDGRTTPLSRAIPIPGSGGKGTGARSGRRSPSPASSWSTSSNMMPMTSMARRPSLPGAPSNSSATAGSSKPRPPWN